MWRYFAGMELKLVNHAKVERTMLTLSQQLYLAVMHLMGGKHLRQPLKMDYLFLVCGGNGTYTRTKRL